jgi:thiol-disulfide isomerase/thioredoxin
MRALLVVLLLLAGLAVGADRVAVGIAEDKVAEQLAAKGGLAGTPTVDIAGFPFLTQAVAGRYDDVRISLTAEQLGQPAGTRADIALHGVHVPLSSVVSGSVEKVPVDRVDGTATLSYALLSAQLGGDTTLRREGDGLRITKTVEVLGQTLPLTAVGTVSLDGNQLVVDVEKAAGAGVDVPGFLVSRVSDLLDLRYDVPALPFGLQLTVVQFSTAFCGPCRATKARLQQLQATRPGLAVVHVDAESHLDEVRELDVRRTPTLFYLGRDGGLIGRSSGAPRADELTALVDAHAGVRS